MKKLTCYKSYRDLKANKAAVHPKPSGLTKESDLKEFISLMASHRCSRETARSNEPGNQSTHE